MANFCASLWIAAATGDPAQYNDYAIEMGMSSLCDEQVNDLLTTDVPQLVFVESGKSSQEDVVGGTSGQNSDVTVTTQLSKRLLTGLVNLLGDTSNMIAHRTDFDNLGLPTATATTEFDFEALNEYGQWFVRRGE
jgi:hypothetical protein